MRITVHSFASTLALSTAILTASTISWAGDGVTEYPTCEGGPSESDVSAAKGAYEAGQVSFQEADYDRALLYWEDAFRRDCTAVKLLLNIARAYELSGNREAAVYALQTYVERRPDASDRASVQKRIQKLQEKIDEQASPAAAPPPTEEPSEKAPEAATSETPDDRSESKQKMNRPIWPIIVTGAGGVVSLVGLGVAFGGLATADGARNDIDDAFPNCSRNGRSWECEPRDGESAQDTADRLSILRAEVEGNADIKSGDQQALAGWVVAGVGLATAGVGVYFWITEWNKPAQEVANTRFTPVVAPGYQGFNFQVNF